MIGFFQTKASTIEDWRQSMRSKDFPGGKGRTFARRLSPLLLGLSLVATAAAQPPVKSPGQSRYTSLDGTAIHYMNDGQGREVLVLIHGWSCNLDYWRDQIP